MTNARDAALFTLLAACVVMFAWWGIQALSEAHSASALIAFLFSSAFLFFAIQWAVMRWMARPRGGYSPAGTTVRPRKLFDVLSLIWIGGATLGALLYIAVSMFDVVDIPTYRSSLVWAMVFIAIAGVATLWRMILHGGDCYLRLTPDCCEVWNGPWLAFRRAKWEDIEQIQDHPLRRKLRGRELVVLALPEGRSATLLSDCVTDDSEALRDWVRFYWQHPEYRDELVDRRGLQRLDDQKFTVE
ncbi:hypothetical protein [Mycolicibacterium sp. S3B2]|uniref:hypothetical protein n=1 Tax=Mycolicibacterium sp. S3B2 TaxID=3415120 RepID=UPI003C7ADFC3